MGHPNALSSGTTNSVTLSNQLVFFAGSLFVHKYGNGSSYTAIVTLVEVTGILEENSAKICLCSISKNKEQ